LVKNTNKGEEGDSPFAKAYCCADVSLVNLSSNYSRSLAVLDPRSKILIITAMNLHFVVSSSIRA